MASQQQQTQQAYVLFFSNYCNYSKDVVSYITKKNIRNAFVFVCVDKVRPLPSFVDRAPLIVSKVTKQIYADEIIMQLLDDVYQQYYPPIQIEATPAFGIGNNQMESEFETLDGDGASSTLDMDQYRIHYISEDDNKLSGRKADSSQLEQYIAQRDTDIKMISTACRPNFH